jgi:hypothetical protein
MAQLKVVQLKTFSMYDCEIYFILFMILFENKYTL